VLLLCTHSLVTTSDTFAMVCLAGREGCAALCGYCLRKQRQKSDFEILGEKNVKKLACVENKHVETKSRPPTLRTRSMPGAHAYADGGGANPFLQDAAAQSDDVVLTPQDATAHWPVVFRKTAKHFSDVGDYLALLAWNRCVMALVGGTSRTTIDTLMTPQFSGLEFVWVWLYTVVVGGGTS
jgi:hypothetical protein